MKKGFYTIMSAQFFSSLADNALLVAAIEMLKTTNAPSWNIPALGPMFALFYVVLAPFLGAFADAVPKGKVMFFANGIKIIGCLMMLFGSHPLMAYAIVGLGAAAYSPAKYGILTELLPSSQLVKANGWIEGLTIASIILGVLLGGQLIGPVVSRHLLAIDFPFIDTSIDTAPEAAISVLVFIYILAAWFNTRIPRTGVEMRPMPRNLIALLPDFWSCNSRLWNDRLGESGRVTGAQALLGNQLQPRRRRGRGRAVRAGCAAGDVRQRTPKGYEAICAVVEALIKTGVKVHIDASQNVGAGDIAYVFGNLCRPRPRGRQGRRAGHVRRGLASPGRGVGAVARRQRRRAGAEIPVTPDLTRRRPGVTYRRGRRAQPRRSPLSPAAWQSG